MMRQRPPAAKVSAGGDGLLGASGRIAAVNILSEGQLAALGIGGEVGDVDRYALGQLDMLLGVGRRRDGIPAKQPAPEPLGVLETDAAQAFGALVLCEQLFLRRVVQIDSGRI